MPLRRADFGLEVPSLVGFRIQDQGLVELELTLIRKGAALAGPVSTLAHHPAVPQPGQSDPSGPKGPPCRGGRPLVPADRVRQAEDDPNAPPPSVTVIGADGSGRKELTLGGMPDWSPDGRRIASSACGGPSDDDITVIDTGSGSFHRLTHAAGYEDSPAWSPDGRRLSWVRHGNPYLARSDGSGATCMRVGMPLTSGARCRPGP